MASIVNIIVLDMLKEFVNLAVITFTKEVFFRCFFAGLFVCLQDYGKKILSGFQ